MRLGGCSVFLGLLVLPVGVVVRRLEVMMGRRVMVSRCHHVMFGRRMLVLFCHAASSSGER
jgi:hypothetical protein